MKYKLASKLYLLVLFILVLLPLWFMLVYSFEDVRGVLRMPPRIIPSSPTLANYQYIATWPLLKWAGNSIVAVSVTVIISIVVYAMAGYVFAFKRFKYINILWSILIVGMMVPRMSLMIPLYVTVKQIGLAGSMAAVILTSIYAPVHLFLARNFMQGIPVSILESAKIDGAGEWCVLFRIVVPLALPVFTVIALFTSINVLGDYVWQSLVFQFGNVQTLIVGMMKKVMERGGGDWNVNPLGRQMAVGVILMTPLLVIFGVANKYFVTGISIGGVKE